MKEEGLKFDNDKRPWHLLPIKPIAAIVDVLAYGAKKYAPNNWQKLADPEDRYYAACLRHLTAWRLGEKTDPESRIAHLAHAACNLIFLMWFGDSAKDPCPHKSRYDTPLSDNRVLRVCLDCHSQRIIHPK